MRGILFDLDGVLYAGDHAIAGAAQTVKWAQNAGIAHLFVTNTTSRPRHSIVDRLAGFGVRIPAESVLTPAVAATQWLREHDAAAAALFIPPATRIEFEEFAPRGRGATTGSAAGSAADVAAVVVGDLGTAWTFPVLNEAFSLLMRESRPTLLALGMTRYWRAPQGLRLDTGPFVRALEYAAGVEAVVLGKPAPAFFGAAAERLGIVASELVMVGDDVRGDVEGAQHAGMKGLLVRTGKFTPSDLTLGVSPDGVLDSIADLPTWWSEQGS